MIFSKLIKSNKYLQYFESDVHVAHSPSPRVEEPTLGLV
jgi:hypothetical protein